MDDLYADLEIRNILKEFILITGSFLQGDKYIHCLD